MVFMAKNLPTYPAYPVKNVTETWCGNTIYRIQLKLFLLIKHWIATQSCLFIDDGNNAF